MVLPHLDPACFRVMGDRTRYIKSNVVTVHNVIPPSGLDCKQLFILSQKTIIDAFSKYKVGNFWIFETIAPQIYADVVKALPMVCLRSLTIPRAHH